MRFIDNNDNTVTDSKTGLTWTKGTIAKDVDHENAEQRVSELGEGWRTPTVDELFSLVDHSAHLPAIDTEAFPETESDWYWTSTPTAWNEAAVWVVNFGGGGVDAFRRDDLSACVRAVRSAR